MNKQTERVAARLQFTKLMLKPICIATITVIYVGPIMVDMAGKHWLLFGLAGMLVMTTLRAVLTPLAELSELAAKSQKELGH